MTRVLLSLLAALSLVACSTASAGEMITLQTADLPATAGMSGEVWQTSNWSGGGASWIRYPGHTAVSIPHPLGRTPASVLIYLSFDVSGVGAAIASGDLSHIDSVTAERVTVSNNTSEDFFLRVVLQ
ncbi:MAG: hypothetical protein IPK60_01875 [Sandaracinaceae bacterium]|jgi:hypothetical protein|nr:hypothetical protein [Sandaracinaceae bacterium]